MVLGMSSTACRSLLSSTRALRRPNRPRGVPQCIRYSSSIGTRKWSTPLAKQLGEAIATTGPISLAAYMRQCLTSPDGGYYTSVREGKDQFGHKGDFVTSPEISQMFGELIGIWLVSEWMLQGRKKSGNVLMEVGPGRGTLMDDVLRSIRNFKTMASSIEAVYLVEASPSLRESQQKLLCGNNPMQETDFGFKSTSKYSDVPVIWCEDIRFIPKDPSISPYIIAHEFFDALPIHAFQSVAPSPESKIKTQPLLPSRLSSANVPQWRELVVSPTPPPSVINPPTPKPVSESPDFELTLAKASTSHSLYLPSLSKRYKVLLGTPGSTIEISPESQSYATEFAVRIGGPSITQKIPGSRDGSEQQTFTKVVGSPRPSIEQKPVPSGAALIVDYGPLYTVPINSLRGIQAHKRVSPFVSPGAVDLSADVDFVALAEAALNGSPGVEVHGPIEQGTWLELMGIRERAAQLLKKMSSPSDDTGRKNIETALARLTEKSANGMGGIYKVMAIVPERSGKKPVGFGGTIGG